MRGGYAIAARTSSWITAVAVTVLLVAVGCERDPTPVVPGSTAAKTPDLSGDGAPASRGVTSADAQPSALASSQVEDTTAAREVLYIQPLGKELPSEDVEFVEKSLLAFYDLKVLMLERAPLPKAAYYPKRKRYRAEKLLLFLNQRLPDDGFRILGLTGVDISTTKGQHEDWGILGLADVDGKACVLSSYRTKRRAKGATHARIRLGKVAVHEIGHTLGLPHCDNQGCLMEDAEGSVLTTDREYDLCHDCRQRLIARGHALADSSIPIPWPKP